MPAIQVHEASPFVPYSMGLTSQRAQTPPRPAGPDPRSLPPPLPPRGLRETAYVSRRVVPRIVLPCLDEDIAAPNRPGGISTPQLRPRVSTSLTTTHDEWLRTKVRFTVIPAAKEGEVLPTASSASAATKDGKGPSRVLFANPPSPAFKTSRAA